MSPGLGLSHPNHNCCVQDHFICAQVAPYPLSGLPCKPHVTVPEKISVRSVQTVELENMLPQSSPRNRIYPPIHHHLYALNILFFCSWEILMALSI